MKALATVLLALIVSASSQQTPRPKPISNYMREVGLIYIEHIDDFDRTCGEEGDDSKRDVCSAALDRWDRVFQVLEDRIDLTLRESKRPAGDRPYFALLKNTKEAEHLRLMTKNMLRYHLSATERKEASLPPERTEERRLQKYFIAYTNCYPRARDDIKSGFYLAEDDMCDDDEVAHKRLGLPLEPPEAVEPVKPPEFAGKEAEARSWKTQTACEKAGWAWMNGVCHATSK